MANENGYDQGQDQREFKLFKEGEVKATVVGNTPSKTAAGDPQYAIKFRVEEGDDKGRYIMAFYRFKDATDKQKHFFFEQMKRAGWDGQRGSLNKPWGEKAVRIEIESETMKASADGKYP